MVTTANAESREDQLITLAQAARETQRITGEQKPPHAATLHRWASNGLAGVRLKTVFAHGQRRTRPSWLRQFFEAVGEAKAQGYTSVDPGPSPNERRREEIARHEEELARAGI